MFGILKGRWRVLKTGIRLEGSYTADSVWMTCCALHNWLLVIDGLDGEWEGQMGANNVNDVRHLGPFAIQRMANPEVEEFGSRAHERRAAIGRQLDGQLTVDSDDDSVEVDVPGEPHMNVDGAIVVNSLSYYEFRRRLVTHFDILYRQHKVSWPKRHK